MEQDYHVTQLIDDEGKFHATGLDSFVKEVKLADCGLSYVVVAIMGPQSSGKSTLLNHLFGTKFREMDAAVEIQQTTKGIWMANCVGIEPCTIAFDLEGSDGTERGTIDTSFEKKIALFALAISDIMLINMPQSAIGLENGGNKPLLRTIFQVMVSLFGPGRKTTLLFVIRDKSSKTPYAMLKTKLLEALRKIWIEVPKPQEHMDTKLIDIFRVEVVALASYDTQENNFKEEVAQLRQRFCNSISPGGLAAGDREHVVPASGFSLSAQKIWEIIKDNKDLHLPSQKVMVANIRCEEIANQKFDQLTKNQDWLKLEKDVKTGPVQGFGGRLSSLLDTCFSEYEKEVKYFDEGVKNSKRHEVLQKKAFDFVYPTYTTMLEHIRSKAFEEFKVRLKQSVEEGEELFASVRTFTQYAITEFDEGRADAAVEQAVNWDVSSIRDKLRSDIEAHAHSIYTNTVVEDLKKMNRKDKEEAQEMIDKIIESHNKQLEFNAKQQAELARESGLFSFIQGMFDERVAIVAGMVSPALGAVLMLGNQIIKATKKRDNDE